MHLIAVIPAYNEAKRIAGVVGHTRRFVDCVVVVDDGSGDTTADVARRAGATVVSHPQNCGAGAATMTGIDAARVLDADVIVTLDADEQHDPNDIPHSSAHQNTTALTSSSPIVSDRGIHSPHPSSLQCRWQSGDLRHDRQVGP